MGFDILRFDTSTGEWTTKTGERPFADVTYLSVVEITKATRTFLGDRHLTGYDIDVAEGQPTGNYNLCHLISLNCMAVMVREYLNGNLNIYQFIELTGAVYFPSNMVLVVPKACAAYIVDWAKFVIARINVSRKIPTKAAMANANAQARREAETAANHLLQVMNNARLNLRYGHASTNKSISRHLDPRTAAGWTIEPVRVLESIYAYFTNRELASIETAYAFYTIQQYRSLIADFQNHDTVAIESRPYRAPLLPQGSLASLSEQMVAHTMTKARNPLMGTRHKFYSRLRRNICCCFTGANLLQLIGLIFLLTYLGPEIASYLGIFGPLSPDMSDRFQEL